MLPGDAIVQWMDLNTKEFHKDTIETMFRKYSHKAFQDKDDYIVNLLPLDDEFRLIPDGRSTLLITDWYGWSEVNRLKRFKRDHNLSTAIIYVGDKSFKFTSETIVPVYNTDEMYDGFHGEVKYHYQNKFVLDLKPGDKLRIRRFPDSNNDLIDYIPVDSMEIGNEWIPYGYYIETKSGFYNANDVYLSTMIGLKI